MSKNRSSRPHPRTQAFSRGPEKGRGPGPGKFGPPSRRGPPRPPGSESRGSTARGNRAGGARDARAEAFSKEGRWVIGIHSCEEVAKVRPHTVAEAIFRSRWQDSAQHRLIADILATMEIEIRERNPEQLDKLGSGHQGVALRVTEAPSVDWSALSQPGQRRVLILDGIEDPHNLGAMLRTSWLTGVDAIFIPEDRAVGLTPTVCKIASGGAEHVPVESHVNFGPVVQRLKDAGFWVYGLSEKGRGRPWDMKLADKIAWIVGNEGAGMRVPTERLCDELVRLPQVASGSSYNASIAVAMALTETCRQFGNPE